jgi:hypothetical protein
LKQESNLGGQFPVPAASVLNQLRARFRREDAGLVKDRLNPQKAFCCLTHLSDNPVGGE